MNEMAACRKRLNWVQQKIDRQLWDLGLSGVYGTAMRPGGMDNLALVVSQRRYDGAPYRRAILRLYPGGELERLPRHDDDRLRPVIKLIEECLEDDRWAVETHTIQRKFKRVKGGRNGAQPGQTSRPVGDAATPVGRFVVPRPGRQPPLRQGH